MNDIIQFINKRFKNDCDWTNGNCYYFAVILKDRFPEGNIFYDVVCGHFVFEYNNQFYDWSGLYRSNDMFLVPWNDFDNYDKFQKQRVIRDSIM